MSKITNYSYIPYNSSNTDYAKINRRSMTKAEQTIRFEFLKKRPNGYKFIRQKMINSFILDFYCAKLMLGIEIDGSSHDNKKDYDQMRTAKLQKIGIKIIRYTNDEVLNDLSKVKDSIIKQIEIIKKEIEKISYKPSG